MPLSTHRDLVRDQLAHPPLGSMRVPGARAPVRAGVSGVGANLLVLAWSAAELERERAAGVRLFKKLGLGAGTRIANALPGALATPGALLLGDVVQDLGGLDIPVGAIENEAAAKQAWALIDLVEPDVIVLNSPSALQLFVAAPAKDRRWLKGVIWLRIDGDSGGMPAVPAAVGLGGWQRTWLAVPEATSFLAISCAAARYHLDSKVTVEVVDSDTGQPKVDGAVGELVITPLETETQLQRYLSHLRGRVATSACPCGIDGSTLDFVA